MKGTIVCKLKLQVLVPHCFLLISLWFCYIGAKVYVCTDFVVYLIFISFLHHPSAELYKKKGMFELLLAAYSTISTQDSAHFRRMNENDATNCKILSYRVPACSFRVFVGYIRVLNELMSLKRILICVCKENHPILFIV